MKSKNYIRIISVLLTIAIIMIPFFAMAQDPEDPDAPIDGGLSMLLAAGAAYGVKKYRDHKKKRHEGEGEELK